jgi:hypothetical protein
MKSPISLFLKKNLQRIFLLTLIIIFPLIGFTFIFVYILLANTQKTNLTLEDEKRT